MILQKLDRAWYDFDGGYDDRNNPFADIPEEYTKKKEEQMAKHAVKRMSAQQRQINKVSTLSPSLSLSLSLFLCKLLRTLYMDSMYVELLTFPLLVGQREVGRESSPNERCCQETGH